MIRDVEITKNEKDDIERIYITFGPHFYIKIEGPGMKTNFTLRASHHGFTADASDASGELEEIIYHVKKAFPKNSVD